MNTEQLITSRREAERRTLRGPHVPFGPQPAPSHAIHPPHAIGLALCRASDILGASILLVLLALPMLLIGLLVKLTSRGPALYSQERVGQFGRTFVMYKFRTMRVDAEAISGPVWAKRCDKRCTRLGGWMRRLSLDELPQLFNVLRGDMSLVGPRPERPYFVQDFSRRLAHYEQRHLLRPGMTGWAQINGWRGDTSVAKRLEYDLYFVRHWSLWFQLRVLLLTPLRLFAEQSPD